MNELTTYLTISSALLAIGIFGILTRRNLIQVLIALELILNAANINFVAFDRFVAPQSGPGQIFAFFVIALAAAELCVILSIGILLVRKFDSIMVDDARELKG